MSFTIQALPIEAVSMGWQKGSRGMGVFWSNDGLMVTVPIRGSINTCGFFFENNLRTKPNLTLM